MIMEKRMDILFYSFFDYIPHESINLYNTKLIVPVIYKSKRNYKKMKRNSILSSQKIYSNISHEYYEEYKLDDDIKNLMNKLHKHKTTGFKVICLLFQNIHRMKQLNIFGLDFCYNKYYEQYNKSNQKYDLTPGHKMDDELFLFKELYQKFKENKNVIIHDEEFLNYLI